LKHLAAGSGGQQCPENIALVALFWLHMYLRWHLQGSYPPAILADLQGAKVVKLFKVLDGPVACVSLLLEGNLEAYYFFTEGGVLAVFQDGYPLLEGGHCFGNESLELEGELRRYTGRWCEVAEGFI